MTNRFLPRATIAAVSLSAVLGMAALSGCATKAEDPRAAAARYQAVVDNPNRTAEDRRLDAVRRPAEFLAFTRAKPGMQVLDISAGAGYTSELLALAVEPGGVVWAQRPTIGPALSRRLLEHPQANLAVAIEPFENPVPADAPKLDLVTLVLNYHDLTYQPIDRSRMLQQVFAALKPGGTFVVIDHAAKPGAELGVGKTLHRIDEQIVINEVKAAGFALDSEGAFLRNPADNHEESSVDTKITTDRFALRFVKP